MLCPITSFFRSEAPRPHTISTWLAFKNTLKDRAQIKLTVQKGQPPVHDSRIFSTKREAQIWASLREQEIRDSFSKEPKSQYTLLDALRKYAEEISPNKKGHRWESVRLQAFENYNLPLEKALGEITPSDIAIFRDSRLK